MRTLVDQVAEILTDTLRDAPDAVRLGVLAHGDLGFDMFGVWDERGLEPLFVGCVPYVRTRTVEAALRHVGGWSYARTSTSRVRARWSAVGAWTGGDGAWWLVVTRDEPSGAAASS